MAKFDSERRRQKNREYAQGSHDKIIKNWPWKDGCHYCDSEDNKIARAFRAFDSCLPGVSKIYFSSAVNIGEHIRVVGDLWYFAIVEEYYVFPIGARELWEQRGWIFVMAKRVDSIVRDEIRGHVS